MLTLKGQLFHTYVTPKGQTKTGDEYGGVDKIEVLVDEELSNGQTRHNILPLKVQDATVYEPHISQDVELPVAAFSPSKGQVVFYVTGKPAFQ